jgi:hypothetical protein
VWMTSDSNDVSLRRDLSPARRGLISKHFAVNVNIQSEGYSPALPLRELLEDFSLSGVAIVMFSFETDEIHCSLDAFRWSQRSLDRRELFRRL